jgi:hypothetical protein
MLFAYCLRKRHLCFQRVKDSKREMKMEMRNGGSLRLAVHFLLKAESVY